MYGLTEADDPRFATTEFVVEANSFELSCLWKQHNNKYEWIQDSSGRLYTIGEIDERPVCLSFLWCKINNMNMLFWEATSIVVDYKMISDWFIENCNPQHNNKVAKCDANNFHVALHATSEKL